MDIKKEREAFEKAFAQTEFYRNKADLYSLLADIDDETFDFFRKNGFGDYSIGEAQAAWSAWQAAKAQAVPEVINVGNELQSWVAVWSFKARHDREDYIVVDANLLADKIEKLTGANA